MATTLCELLALLERDVNLKLNAPPLYLLHIAAVRTMLSSLNFGTYPLDPMLARSNKTSELIEASNGPAFVQIDAFCCWMKW